MIGEEEENPKFFDGRTKVCDGEIVFGVLAM